MLKNTPNTPEEALAEWRNENAKQIDAAVKLLRPESRYDVETALIEMKYEYRQLRIGFIDKHKPAKLAARDLAKALERVQRLMKNKDLPIQLHLGFPDEAIAPMQELGMVYFAIVGGAAALETTQIEEIEEVMWEDLMPECLWKFRVKDFGPLTVGIDAHGNSLYHDVQTRAKAKLEELIARF